MVTTPDVPDDAALPDALVMGTSGVTKAHPRFAKFYARYSPKMEASGLAGLRTTLLRGATGEAIDIGAGDGQSFKHFPATVSRVLAVEPEPHLRARAEHRAKEAPVPVQVVDGVAEALPADDDMFDVAVVMLVLCSLDDVDRALAEIRRVLRPGGQLRFLEHVRAESAAMAAMQRSLDATVWPRLFGGCHTSRRTAEAIERAGFEITEVSRPRFPSGPPMPTAFHVLGTATAP